MKIVFLVFFVVLLASCGGSSDSGPVAGMRLQAGPDITLHYPYPIHTQRATEGNGGELSYSSSDSSVASVSSLGEVTIHSYGVTTITVSEAGSDEFLAQSDSYVLRAASMSEQLESSSGVNIIENDTHDSLHISSLEINGQNLDLVTDASFSVSSKPGSFARAISATYPAAGLNVGSDSITLPIFGMYSDYLNDIRVELVMLDGSVATFSKEVMTEPMDEASLYHDIELVVPVSEENVPSFSYFVMRSRLNGPVVMDIDSEIRWALKDTISGHSSLFDGNKFVSFVDDKIIHIYLDGRLEEYTISASGGFTNLKAHHEAGFGKSGYLVQVHANKGDIFLPGTLQLEVDQFGSEIKQWQFNEIFRDYMVSEGDDPTNLVRDTNWFHKNSIFYSAKDDSLIASSRENFVVKIDYETGDIQWLLGDETKHWFVNFPSLQRLSLMSSDVKPIGQHSVSVINDDELLLFNNGTQSFNPPEGEPSGLSLDLSYPSRYVIDEDSGTADLVWSYDAGLKASVCSSVYQDDTAENGSYLINYAQADVDGVAKPVIQIVNDEQELLFHVNLVSVAVCEVTWNSIPVNLLDIQN